MTKLSLKNDSLLKLLSDGEVLRIHEGALELLEGCGHDFDQCITRGLLDLRLANFFAGRLADAALATDGWPVSELQEAVEFEPEDGEDQQESDELQHRNPDDQAGDAPARRLHRLPDPPHVPAPR